MDPRNIEHDKVMDINENGLLVSHLTIRQSLSLLLFKLIVIELGAAFLVIVLHSLFIYTDLKSVVENANDFNLFNIPIYLLLVIIKTTFVFFTIIEWMNNYYEITPQDISHHVGLFFKDEERHTFFHLGSLKIEQGILGRLFNFGSLKFYNWALQKEFVLFAIHNPMKYYPVLKSLLPQTDKEEQVIRRSLLEPEEEM